MRQNSVPTLCNESKSYYTWTQPKFIPKTYNMIKDKNNK